MKFVESDVKKLALEKNLKIYQPEKIRDNEEFLNTVKELNPDLICVVAYGKILPKKIIEIPKKGCINVHASLLPKYRGAAPIQWAVLNGDKTTGVTTMYMNEKMDEGDIILQKETEIGEYETTGELWDRLSIIGANLLVETVKQIENETAPRIKQGDNYTLAPMLNKEMAKIDFKKNIQEVKDKIYGLNPIMGAYVIYKGKKIKIWKAEMLDNIFAESIIGRKIIEDTAPGEILMASDKQGLYIKVNGGVLKVLEIQGENSKKMNTCEFLRGNKLHIGDKFE